MSFGIRSSRLVSSPRPPQHQNQYFENSSNFFLSEVLCRTLSAGAPRLPYRRRKEERKSVVFWSHRKSLLAAVEFLTAFGFAGARVVYVGAAPGAEMGVLSDLFPSISFVLYDTADFAVKPSERIEIRHEAFTDETARLWASESKHALFISDASNANWMEQTNEEVEATVKRDMAAQQQWHRIMCPLRSLLRFRLPWTKGTTEYLDGTVFLPVWGPQTTTETYLVPNEPPRDKLWDNGEYEEQMFRFNTVTRVQVSSHPARAVLISSHLISSHLIVLLPFVFLSSLLEK